MRSRAHPEPIGTNPRPAGDADSSRNLAIDRLRGVLIILMVGGNYLSGIQAVPAFLKHAPDIGFTIADSVAPAFVFVIGLNFGPSLARRTRQGAGAAYRHFLRRYLALIGIGAVLSAGQTIVTGVSTDWGVLQAIGAAGLICLIVIRLPAWTRVLIGLLMLICYQYLLDAWALPAVLGSVQGGLFGTLSWGALLILSTAVAEAWRTGSGPYGIVCAALVLAAAISASIVPVSKVRVSLSFVLISLAISAIAFLLFDLAARVVAKRAGFLCWWGENPLTLYLLHLVILGLFMLPPVAWWYAAAPLWLAAAQLVVILAAMSAVAWWLRGRRVAIGV